MRARVRLFASMRQNVFCQVAAMVEPGRAVRAYKGLLSCVASNMGGEVARAIGGIIAIWALVLLACCISRISAKRGSSIIHVCIPSCHLQ